MMPRFLRPGWLVIYGLLIWGAISLFSSPSKILLEESVVISEGETIAKVYNDVGWRKKLVFKRFMKNHADKTVGIQPGSYFFSGSYTPQELLDVFLEGPKKSYTNLTILEGRSSYDIDTYLTDKGLIESGEYLAFVFDQKYIERYAKRYEFIQTAIQERGTINSLEGYLYPSTYFVDPQQDTIDQLVYLQLEAFNDTVWSKYGEGIKELSGSLKSRGYNFTLSTYGAVILAAIIEKEERVPVNRVKIASVFYNRLNDGMRIDADISLCYGLKLTHDACTPSVIGQSVHDPSNPYNTRAVSGLTPTPIGNPTISSISALIEAQKSANYFYLHDSTGQIHLAKDLSGHNINKSKYID